MWHVFVLIYLTYCKVVCTVRRQVAIVKADYFITEVWKGIEC
jgi:hypothetical protein